jgi:hypothetical protein
MNVSLATARKAPFLLARSLPPGGPAPRFHTPGAQHFTVRSNVEQNDQLNVTANGRFPSAKFFSSRRAGARLGGGNAAEHPVRFNPPNQ